MKFNLTLLLLLLMAMPLIAAEKLPTAAERQIDFARDIQPILKANCYDCHGADLQESNYRLDVRDVALTGGDFGDPPITPGKSGDSPLVRYVAGVDEDLTMPPEGDGEPLTVEQVALLRAWIDQGAKWPDELAGDAARAEIKHWSLQPIRDAGPPTVASDWPREPIDQFIYARLNEAKLKPSLRAERTTLIRRLFLDMHGLPPTPEQVREFLADERPDAFDRLVDEVLASPRYGERWAQHWLDVVRFAETDGFEVNTPRANAWPYRDYVIAAFNDDKPYDKFVFEQLAGDLVGADAATGFLVAAPVLLPGQIGKDEDSILAARQDALDEMVTATSATFLGLTVGCARCHNHKFDPILQKDYYSLQAVFAGVNYGSRESHTPQTEQYKKQLEEVERQLANVQNELAKFAVRAPVNARRNEERFEPIAARYVRFTIENTNKYEGCIDELEIYPVAHDGEDTPNVALASAGTKVSASSSKAGDPSHQLQQINDGQYGNTRSWMCDQGTGWVQIELPEVTTIDRIIWQRDRTGQYDDRLATQYRIEVAIEPGKWTTVSSFVTRFPFGTDTANLDTVDKVPVADALELVAQLAKLQQQQKELKPKATNLVYAGTFHQPGRSFRLRRGDHKQKLEQVTPDIVEVLGSLKLPADTPERERRAALAKAITAPDNPLTARVMVNRMWHHHFGTGLVSTPSDFGKMGSKPSHPELLDYLATEFIRNGWSIKHLQRLILRSSTYQQAATTDNLAAREVDADVRLLWRFPSRRLEAEAVRDSVLQVSDVLRHEMGGPGFPLFQPRVGLDLYQPLKEHGPPQWRRLIYAHKVRMAQDGVFTAFDMPDCGQLCSKRSNSTTPLQALNLFNSDFMLQQSKLFEARVVSEVGDAPDAQVERLFQLCFGRNPSAADAEAATAFVRQHGLDNFCRVILNTNEFVVLP